MAINYKQAALLCTRNELKLVERCKPGVLTVRTLDDVTADALQARGYFDKWRQKAITQARERQRVTGARGDRLSAGLDRSAAKAELFRDVLAKLEKRMETIERELASGVDIEVPPVADAPDDAPAGTTTVKKKRSAKKKAAAKKTAAKTATKKKRAAKKKVATTKKKRAVKKKRKAANEALESTARKATRGGARAGARKRITSNRVAQSGYSTRVRGHVSAAGRRAQAKRNTRR